MSLIPVSQSATFPHGETDTESLYHHGLDLVTKAGLLGPQSDLSAAGRDWVLAQDYGDTPADRQLQQLMRDSALADGALLSPWGKERLAAHQDVFAKRFRELGQKPMTEIEPMALEEFDHLKSDLPELASRPTLYAKLNHAYWEYYAGMRTSFEELADWQERWDVMRRQPHAKKMQDRLGATGFSIRLNGALEHLARHPAPNQPSFVANEGGFHFAIGYLNGGMDNRACLALHRTYQKRTFGKAETIRLVAACQLAYWSDLTSQRPIRVGDGSASRQMLVDDTFPAFAETLVKNFDAILVLGPPPLAGARLRGHEDVPQYSMTISGGNIHALSDPSWVLLMAALDRLSAEHGRVAIVAQGGAFCAYSIALLEAMRRAIPEGPWSRAGFFDMGMALNAAIPGVAAKDVWGSWRGPGWKKEPEAFICPWTLATS